MSTTTATNDQQRKSILVMGATGLTGKACIHNLSKHPSKPILHAFCRNPSKLDDETRELCQSIVQGNARKESDIRKALIETKANWIIVCVGNGQDVSKNDIRTVSAKAIVTVLQQDPDLFGNVRIMLVSSGGAGTSKIIVGMGIGKLISLHLRHVLRDHTGQEAAFASLKDRTIVVRPSALTSDKPTGKLVEVGDKDKGPSIHTDRNDLAQWISHAIMSSDSKPCVVNLTGVKQ